MEKSGDGQDALARKVMSWLSDQGYPLEMRTAEAFRSRGLAVRQSEYYFDSDSGGHREIDLVARIPLHERDFEVDHSFLCPVIECKSSPGKPWIIFSGGENIDAVDCIAQRFVLRSARTKWEEFARRLTFNRDSLLHAPLPLFRVEYDVGYSAVRSSLGKSREDVAYGAMTSVSKAAYAVANMLSPALAMQVAVPIIVVDSPLFKCTLDMQGNAQLERIAMGSVAWRNKIADASLSHSIIRVVTESGLPQLVSDICLTADTLRELRWRFSSSQ
ncbi:hypothetical protein ACFPA8_16860 [Streptomyces ovatisporus]|uniref:Uncharacterized protein n=1 Tax=Streptomyces ovatisporus TaxID=1128682 RepID=A0ABV9AAU0_9ACTN